MKSEKGFLKGTVVPLLQVGRIELAGVSIVGAMVGAYSSGVLPSVIQLTELAVVAVLVHTATFALNDYIDMNNDMKNPLNKWKPLVSGKLRPKTVLLFSAILMIMAMGSSAFFFQSPVATALLALTLFLGYIYDKKGKYMPWVGDLFPAASLYFAIVYGAYVVSFTFKMLSLLVALILSLEVFYENAIEGSIKDVEGDRIVGTPTRAVVWGVDPHGNLRLTDPIMIYAFFIQTLFHVCLMIPYLLGLLTWKYLVFVALALPVLILSMTKYSGGYDRKRHRKYFNMRLAVGGFLYKVVLLDYIGLGGVFLMMVAEIVWIMGITKLICAVTGMEFIDVMT